MQKQVRAAFQHNFCMQDFWIYNDLKLKIIKAPYSLCKPPSPQPRILPSLTAPLHTWLLEGTTNENSMLWFIRNMAEPVEPESKWLHKPLSIGTPCMEYLPWFSRSRSFVIRPLCDFSNNDNKLQDSSKLKFCCLREKNAKSPKHQSSSYRGSSAHGQMCWKYSRVHTICPTNDQNLPEKSLNRIVFTENAWLKLCRREHMTFDALVSTNSLNLFNSWGVLRWRVDPWSEGRSLVRG